MDIMEMIAERKAVIEKFVGELSRNGVVALCVTVEEFSEDDHPQIGVCVMLDPVLRDIVADELGEEAADKLAEGIQEVLDKAGKEVSRMIVKQVTGVEPEFELVNREEK